MNWRRCAWIGKKSQCSSHTKHSFTISPEDDDGLDVPETESRDRVAFNKKVVRYIAEFTGAVDLSFHRAAGMATFKLVTNLIQLGASLPRQGNQIVNITNFLDRFSDRRVRDEMIQVADDKFQADIANLRDVHFVNISVDSGTVHSFSVIPC
jgi:hypothetical protein